jgi:hypothetical protein
VSKKDAKPEAPESPKAPALRGWAKVFGFPKDPSSYGKYWKRPSPDRAFTLVFEPGIEYAMMRYAHQFRLVDSSKRVVQAFHGLMSPMQLACWSPDSRIVAISISDPEEGLLLLDVRRQKFSLICYNVYQQIPSVTSAGVRIRMDRDQFIAIFEDVIPVPGDVSIRFAALRWLAAPKAGPWKLDAALRAAPNAYWQPPRTKALRAYAKEHGIIL